MMLEEGVAAGTAGCHQQDHSRFPGHTGGRIIPTYRPNEKQDVSCRSIALPLSCATVLAFLTITQH